jgi:hypothetical protein
MVIDIPVITMNLLEKLAAALPLPAQLKPEVQASITGGDAARRTPRAAPPKTCTSWRRRRHTLQARPGTGRRNEAFLSITHLRFDARLLRARAIVAYQKHRVKRLRRQPF